MVEFLLAAEIALSCLNRCVSKQELDLLKFRLLDGTTERMCNASRGEPDS
jgi:hypothetical protein